MSILGLVKDVVDSRTGASVLADAKKHEEKGK